MGAAYWCWHIHCLPSKAEKLGLEVTRAQKQVRHEVDANGNLII